MADRIAVMKDAELQAFAPPDELYERPPTMFIGGFVGNPPMNFAEVEVSRSNGSFHARREGMDLVVPAKFGEKATTGGKVMMGIRPEDVTIADEGTVPAEVFLIEPLGRDHLITVEFEGIHFNILADPALGLNPGDKVKLLLKMGKVQFFDLETEKSLLWT